MLHSRAPVPNQTAYRMLLATNKMNKATQGGLLAPVDVKMP